MSISEIYQERSQHQQESFDVCSNNLTYATTFIHLIHIAYLPNNIASFCNDKNNFLNGSGKIEYCRGFCLKGSFDISCCYPRKPGGDLHLFEKLFEIGWENNRDCDITIPLSLKTMEVQMK